MPHTCLVRFTEPNAARGAIRRLMQEGISPSAMDVMTSQPIHGEPFLPEPPSKLRTWALCGAGVGCLGGLLLATMTALNYPLVKGGMPIVSPWTAGLVTYETTMLGAVLATLVGLLVELRLPNLKKLPYQPASVDGEIVVAVNYPEQARPAVERVVNSSGTTGVDWISL